MPPHLSITCPQVNNSLIIIQGIQINLVGKINYIAACTNWHLKWWPRDGADRQWPQPAAALVHLLAALSASYYALGHQGQVHTPTGSGAEGPHRLPIREQHWPRAPRTLWAASKHVSGVSMDLGPNRQLGRVHSGLEGQRLSLSASWLQGQNKKHSWVLAVSIHSCFSTALQHNMARTSTCPREIISPYYRYSGERNQVGKCKAIGQGMELVSILIHNSMTRQQQQCKTLKNFNICLIQFMPFRAE